MRERWKQIRIWYIPFPYNISNYGRIENRRTFNLVKLQNNSNGYLKVTLCGHQFLVHRLVLDAFIGSCPEGCEVNHIDSDKKNNVVSNLEWISHKENVRKARSQNANVV
jgi:hypothetical protein